MRTRSRSLLRPLFVAVGLIAAGALAGCSSGGDAVDKDQVEETAAKELAAQVGADEPPKVECPADLDAEVGATMTCELTADGDDNVLPVLIKVTSVDDGNVQFDIEVEDTPIGE